MVKKQHGTLRAAPPPPVEEPATLDVAASAASWRAALKRLSPLLATGIYPLVRVVLHGGAAMVEATNTTHFARVHLATRGPVTGAGGAVIPAAFLRGHFTGEGARMVRVRTYADGRVRVGDARATHARGAMAPETFPAEPPSPASIACVLDARGLARGLAAVTHAVSFDDTRPHLAGVCLDVAKSRVVATDGHRIAYASVGRTHGLPDASMRPVLPRVLCGGVAASFFGGDGGDPSLFVDERVCKLACPNGERVGWWIDTNMVAPQTDQYVPTSDAAAWFGFDAAALLSTVDAATGGHDGRRAVILTPGPSGTALCVAGCNHKDPCAGPCLMLFAELGSMRPGVDDPRKIERAFRIGVNARYLSDALRAVGRHGASMRISGELDPIVIHATDGERLHAFETQFVIMPVRV